MSYTNKSKAQSKSLQTSIPDQTQYRSNTALDKARVVFKGFIHKNNLTITRDSIEQSDVVLKKPQVLALYECYQDLEPSARLIDFKCIWELLKQKQAERLSVVITAYYGKEVKTYRANGLSDQEIFDLAVSEIKESKRSIDE
jgi:hypothetical protein